MKLKANLHFHSKDDPQAVIGYTFFEGVDEATRLGLEVLALTCHNLFVDKAEYRDYAKKNNILLIPGIEKKIEKRHVVILAASKEAEKIKSFGDLREYKKSNPRSFILAPHPYFYGGFSLKEKLEENIDLFDAVENSWFYSKMLNRNKRGEGAAKKFGLPFIATSDTHILPLLNSSYAIVEAREKSVPAIFEAIRTKKFRNVNPPKKLWREMLLPFAKFELENRIRLLAAKLYL